MTDQPSSPTGDEPSLGGAQATGQHREPGLGGEAALTHLIDAVHAEEPDIRFRAVEQLEAVGSDRAVDLLERAADDPNTSVRERSIRALGRIQHDRAVDILLDKLENELLSQVRAHVILALGETGSERAVDPLIRKFQSEVDQVERHYAALALGQIGAPQAVAVLAQALQDNYLVRRAAGHAIGRIGQKHPEAIQPVVDQLVEDLFAAPSSEQRAWAIDILSNLRPTGIVPRLLAVMQDPEQPLDQRLAAISGLKAVRDKRAAAALLELFATTQNGRLRYRAAHALVVIRDREAIPELIELLKHEAWQVRRFTARILGRRDVRSALPHLILLLEDGRALVREEAAHALRRLHQAENISQARPPLIRAMTDRVGRVRNAASRALGRIGGRDVVNGLAAFYQASDEIEQRRVAMSALRQINYYYPGTLQDVLEVVRAAASDEDPTLAWHAGYILQNLRS